MPELGPVWDAVAKLGIAIVLGVALWYFVLSPRKRPDGTLKSSMLVQGWVHDGKIAEVDALRSFYEKMLADAHAAADNRAQELRVLRDEERAARLDAEANTKRVLDDIGALHRDMALLLEISKLAVGDGAVEGASRAEAD